MARLAGFVVGALLALVAVSRLPAFTAELQADSPMAPAGPNAPAAPLAGAVVDASKAAAAIIDADVAVDERAATSSTDVPLPGEVVAPPGVSGLEPLVQASATGSAPLPAAGSVATGFFEEDAPTALPAIADAQPVPEAGPAPAPVPGDAAAPQWHPVWQGFAARRSADGFAQRLASLTGLDYRVVKLAAGRYQVEVSYQDEPDRVRAVANIEQATGLVLARSDGDSP